MDRKTVVLETRDITLEICGTVDSAIAFLNECKANAPEGAILEIDPYAVNGSPSCFDSEYYTALVISRYETDDEMNARLTKEASDRAERRAKTIAKLKAELDMRLATGNNPVRVEFILKDIARLEQVS